MKKKRTWYYWGWFVARVVCRSLARSLEGFLSSSERIFLLSIQKWSTNIGCWAVQSCPIAIIIIILLYTYVGIVFLHYAHIPVEQGQKLKMFLSWNCQPLWWITTRLWLTWHEDLRHACMHACMHTCWNSWGKARVIYRKLNSGKQASKGVSLRNTPDAFNISKVNRYEKN